MCTRSAFAAALLLVVVPVGGFAQTTGLIDAGLRVSDVSGDEARFQRYRDMSDGLAIEQVRFDHAGERSFLSVLAEHAGRRDQRYTLDYAQGGKFKLSFIWDQIPQYVSVDTRTLYETTEPGVFRMDDAIQAAIQNSLAAQAEFAENASPFEIRSRRHVAAFAFVYSPTRELDVDFKLRSTSKKGEMPYMVTFGQSNVVELPAPIDTRTTDVVAGAEWANRRGSVRVTYDGSLFDNNVTDLVWDNPRRLTDLAAAPAQGRAALAPNTSLHAVTTAAGLNLPARSRVTGSVTVGSWQQDDTLLPYTINTALASPSLPRMSAQAEARTLAMNYTATSRPMRMVWLNARYRFYEFDNQTLPFETDGRVRYDASLVAGPHGPSFLSSTLHHLDLDAALTPMKSTSFRVGYAREAVARTHRIYADTDENVFRASADTTLSQVVTLRGIYEHSERTGSGFNEELLIEVNEQPAMRHYDVADRNRDRVTALVQVSPLATLGLTGSIARGHDDYDNTGFGLLDSKTMSYSVGIDYVPDDRISSGLTYVDDRYDTLQLSRNANAAQFQDATRNWSTDGSDRTQTWTANLDLLKLVTDVDIRVAYDRSYSRATYVYAYPPDSTLVAPDPLSPVINRLQRATTDVRYYLSERLAVGAVYWFDEYDVEDFSMGPETIDAVSIANNLFLGYVYRPYRAHVGSVRILYTW
jgi:MtrB/PioB family decaheme-associated outer membrane protein